MKCRGCNNSLQLCMADLGAAPPSNAYLHRDALTEAEVYYPLRVMVCTKCWLVQTEDYVKPEVMFSSEYAYHSSASTSWLQHSLEYFKTIVPRFNLNADSFVVEIASNDGYLLRNFVSGGIPCLGIEPTEVVAGISEGLGIPTLKAFFDDNVSELIVNTRGHADLIVANNVYAHVPDINGFTKNIKNLLNSDGVVTIEFPHLLNLIKYIQFDTIYHEHFSYLSLSVIKTIFENFGLRVFDVEKLPTHGGSLRIYGCHYDSNHNTSKEVDSILQEEINFGLMNIKVYEEYQTKIEDVQLGLTSFLISQKLKGKKIDAYGAAAKGNTFLNYAGIKKNIISHIYDGSISKQGKFMPGSRIPILPSSCINENKPDIVLVLPWNIIDEVLIQHQDLINNGTVFVTAVPSIKLFKR